ncbi:segregation/condensation protein A [Candidatus Micrarchaeota archaeon]|nr:segregation/condensation protein A [Candidatus Micrarchaeota archaeon]MBU1681678.1 segregation/condensation protein A [Candidatus Micrarchaeota archaeon]
MPTQTHLQSFAHFESMVAKPTWKDILLELISSNRVDPWNVDLLDLSDAFISKVREMDEMDFIIQANVILAASILLKYKSDYLKFLSYQTELAEFPAAEEPEPIPEIPQLELSSRIPPRRQITAEELINEMERVIKYENVERVRIPKGSIVDTIDMQLSEHDLENDLAKVIGLIEQHTDSEGWSLFSKITEGNDSTKKVYNLLCLLYLVQDEKINIKQDKMYGEIFINLKESIKPL